MGDLCTKMSDYTNTIKFLYLRENEFRPEDKI